VDEITRVQPIDPLSIERYGTILPVATQPDAPISPARHSEVTPVAAVGGITPASSENPSIGGAIDEEA